MRAAVGMSCLLTSPQGSRPVRQNVGNVTGAHAICRIELVHKSGTLFSREARNHWIFVRQGSGGGESLSLRQIKNLPVASLRPRILDRKII